jgi:hypothetical protein
MRRLLLGMIMCAQAAALAQLSTDHCCEMKIVPDSRSPTELAVTISNLNGPAVELGVSISELDLHPNVTLTSGGSAPRTEFGKRLLAQEVVVSTADVTLEAGRSLTFKLDLRQVFELESGKYNVDLRRDILIAPATAGDKIKTFELKARAAIEVP